MVHGQEDAEALRRRLYAPGATDEDRARFAAAAPARKAAATGVEPDPGGRPAVRRSRRVALLAAAAVLVLAVVGVALLRPEATPVRAVAEPAAVALSAADRDELLGRLRQGEEAGIAAYLVVNRPPPGLAGHQGVSTVEGRGSGSGSLRLDLEVFGGAGRATVLLVLGQDARADWRLQRLATDDRTPVVHLQTVAERGGQQQAGELTSATIRYAAGRRPVRLDVDVPDGVPWGAAVVFSD